MADFIRHDARDAGPRRPHFSAAQPHRSSRSWTSNGVHYTVDTSTYSTPILSFGTLSGRATGHLDPYVPSLERNSPTTVPFGLLGDTFGLFNHVLAMYPQGTVVGEGGMGQGSRRLVPINTDSETDDTDLAYETMAVSSRPARRKSFFSRLKNKLVDGRNPPRDDSSSRERSPPQHTPRMAPRRHSSNHGENRQPAREQHLRQSQHQRQHQHQHQHQPYPHPHPHPHPHPQHHAPQPQPPPQTQHHHNPEFIQVDYDDDTESEPEYTHRSRSRARRPHDVDPEMGGALEHAVEVEHRNVCACKQRLTQASRQSTISSAQLQRIVDELRQHEAILANATNNLNDFRVRQVRNSRPPRPASTQRPPPPSQPRQSKSSGRMYDMYAHGPPRPLTRNLHDEFIVPPAPPPPFARASRHPDPIFFDFEHSHRPFDPFGRTTTPIDAFEPFFDQSSCPTPTDAHLRFFAMPGVQPEPHHRKRTRHSFGEPRFPLPNGMGGGPDPGFPRASLSRPPPAAAVAAPQPPATALQPDEAKRLYHAYNDQWTALSSTNPDIPYPARGLHEGGLLAREAIWAPTVRTHVAHWSDDMVMKANAQAFFLGVAGLTPRYTENPASGRIEVGFDRGAASPAQVHRLVEVLKREKVRWHSDRLGRRNGGAGGVNEALQKNVKARAVFHAVCELMEVAQ